MDNNYKRIKCQGRMLKMAETWESLLANSKKKGGRGWCSRREENS